MSIQEALLPKFDQETQKTRTLLEVVPEDKFAWSPHEKSMTLGRLASHLPALLGWSEAVLNQDEFDVAPVDSDEPQSPTTFETKAEILEAFDKNASKTHDLIASKTDAEMMAPWSLKSGGKELFTAPKVGVAEVFLLHHLIHHRGQLSVYLRLCDVPVPQTYGPTADYPDF